MSTSTSETLTSTKLVVEDLEKSAAFYCEAYGLEQKGRIQADIGGEAIDEIFLGRPGEQGVPLMVMKYLDRPAPPTGEVMLVFMTQDIEALCERVVRAGGSVYVPPYQSEATPVTAAFTKDPEGHVSENVQLPG